LNKARRDSEYENDTRIKLRKNEKNIELILLVRYLSATFMIICIIIKTLKKEKQRKWAALLQKNINKSLQKQMANLKIL